LPVLLEDAAGHTSVIGHLCHRLLRDLIQKSISVLGVWLYIVSQNIACGSGIPDEHVEQILAMIPACIDECHVSEESSWASSRAQHAWLATAAARVAG
jgi:hypothetical protein